MNINQIIDEELAEAGARIRARLQSLLMGGSGASPGRPPGTTKAAIEGGRNGPITIDEGNILLAKAVQYLRQNPGARSMDMMRELGIAGNLARLAWLRERLKPLVKRKGSSRATVLYLKDDAPKKDRAEDRGKSETAERLAAKALIYIKANPGCSNMEVGKTLLPSSSDQRYQAYQKLVNDKKIRVVKSDKPGPKLRNFFPI